MKAKKVFAIAVTALIVVSAVLISFPLAKMEATRNSMNSNPTSSGAFYTYLVGVDRSSYSSVNGSADNYFFPCGVLKLTVTSNAVNVREKIFCSSQFSEYYCVNSSYPKNSTFVRYFLNTIPMQIGSFVKLPSGVVGTVVNDIFNYHIEYQTNNTSLSTIGAKMGYTSPTEVLIKNVNESLVPSSDNYWLTINRNQFDYDHAGNINVLVRSFITGNISFLSMIFHTHGLQYSIFFSLFLIATNVGLHPLDYSHYLLEYVGYLPPMWIFSLLILYSVVRSARKRTSKR
jgi:hypothetical protein